MAGLFRGYYIYIKLIKYECKYDYNSRAYNIIFGLDT